MALHQRLNGFSWQAWACCGWAGMIAIRDVSAGHVGVPLVERLSVTIPTGSILALLGASGCGKTTLLRTIAGLQQPMSGVIQLFDQAPADLYGTGRLHYLHQSPALWRHLTVYDHIRVALRLIGEPVRASHVTALLEQLGLSGSERKYPHELSLGMQARLALARAFAEPPDFLLVDEPFANLDELRRERLNLHLQTLSQDAGCTIVMVTHDVVEAIRFASRILVFPAGSKRLHEVALPRGLRTADPNALPPEARRVRDTIIGLIQHGKLEDCE